MARSLGPRDDDELDTDIPEDDDYTVDLSEDEEPDDVGDEEGDDDETDDQPKGKSNDWEKRFKGLQSSLQREVEEKNRLRQENLMTKAQAVRVHLASQNLEPQEAQRQFEMWVATEALKLQAEKNQSDQQSVEEVARAAYLQHLSTEYNIDPASKTFDRLSKIKDADDMRAFAEEVGTQKKSAQKTTKKAVAKVTKSRNFDSGGGRVGSPPKRKHKNLDDAAAAFAKYKIEL